MAIALAVVGTAFTAHSAPVFAAGGIAAGCNPTAAPISLNIANVCGGGGGGGTPSCYASSCDGRDPNAYPACQNDATTPSNGGRADIYVNGVYAGYVELRWSQTCDANWARITRTDGNTGWNMWAAVNGAHGSESVQANGSPVWTTMTDGTGSAYACGIIYEDYNGNQTSGSACTQSF